MQRDDVLRLFEGEFAALREKVTVLDLAVSDAPHDKSNHVANPGAYVYWHPTRGIIRVGRSFDNSRKRALSHVRANTGGAMSNLLTDTGARLLLFNVKDRCDLHWVAALEVFFEQQCTPEIRSGRLG